MINILYAQPLEVSEGELLGCWHAWATVFDVNPLKNWKDYQFPKHHLAATMNNLLLNDQRKIFGLDVMLRSIKQSHLGGAACDIMQATGEFVIANQIYFTNVNDFNLPQTVMIQGVALSDFSIQTWNDLPRLEKIGFLKFGIERLEWVLNHTGIDPNDLIFPQNFYNPSYLNG